MADEKCDLCGDVGKLDLRAVCHPTAPLRIELSGGVLSIYCYVPECNRFVAQFPVAPNNYMLTALQEADATLKHVLLNAPNYDWNADPLKLTLRTGKCFEQTDAAIAKATT